MKDDRNDFQDQAFTGLPYPLTAPEGSETIFEETLTEDSAATLLRLLDELSDIIMHWKSIAHAERMKLSSGRITPEMPMEFRAGVAQGMDNAARDVENLLVRIGH